MNNNKKSIRRLYRPGYIKEKNEKKRLDEYIKLESNNTCGSSFGTQGSDLSRWRGCARKKRSFEQNLQLFEIKQIFKRFKKEMNDERKGLPNEYIDTLTKLLSMENQKEYLKQRIEMIQKSNNSLLLNDTVNHSPKKGQFGFYITNSNRHNYKVSKSNQPFHYNPISNCNNYNPNVCNQVKQSISTSPNKTLKNKVKDSDEENILIDPDQTKYGHTETMKHHYINKLTKLNNFYNPKTKKILFKPLVNITKNRSHINTSSIRQHNNELSFSKHYFLKYLNLRKQREQNNNLRRYNDEDSSQLPSDKRDNIIISKSKK